MTLVLPFSAIRAADLPRVGGKGANLGEMTRAGFPVPEGFCLTTAAFRRFLAASGQAEALYASLDALQPDDVEGVRRVGAQVRAALMQAPIPQEVADALLEAWQATGAQAAYAVRSSATAEDLPTASFAGQQDTYLNVRGQEALLAAVRSCWVSLFTDRAILYRARNGFDHRAVALAVVVQRMIPAEVSGTMFTADPVSGHRHTLILDASFGLGEALVSGLVTPDAWRVDKRSRLILERRLADKEIAIYPDPDGGVRRQTIPPEKRRQPSLTEAQVLALTDLGCRVEAHYGQPQDMEWAFAGGQLYLLQTRPITSLYPIDGLRAPDDTLHIYFSLGHQQMMTRAMPPLSLTTILLLVPFAHHPGRFDNTYLRLSGGRLFADITSLLRHRLARRAILGLLSQLDALAPEAVRQAMKRPEFHAPSDLHLSLSQIKSALPYIGRIFSALGWRDLTGFVSRTNDRMEAFIADLARRLQAAPDREARLEAMVVALETLFPFFLVWIPEAAAGMAAARLLPRLARRWLPPDELEALTQGLPGNVVTEMNLALGDLAELARRSPALSAWFAQLDAHEGQAWLEQAARLEGAEAFMRAWEAFLRRYGARGPSEIDIAAPRWYEDPLPVLRVIAAHLQQEENSRARYQRLVQARAAAFQQLLEAAGRGPLGPLRRRLFRRLYHVSTAVGGMREHHKFLVIRALAVIKESLKTLADELTAEGRLQQPEDIWLLTWRELYHQEAMEDWSARIRQRRADLARYQQLTPPLIITSDGETPHVQYRREDAPPGALLGNPVSPGVVEGVARVIQDPARETLQPGEILVAPFTDPGWTPLFINAAGLIMEVGGALTHGAVVAREYGIPAVVGVRQATRLIRSGQRLRLDGNRGIIEILSPEKSPRENA